MNDAWEKGKGVSLHFYWKKFDAKEKEFNHAFQLPDYFAPMIGDKKEVKIADLGAGAFCTCGSTWPTAKVTVIASDLMADDFNVMLQKKNITPFIQIEKQNMEDLHYPDNEFDIVHCTNALDHTTSPYMALLEMHRICKPGGWIYLRHYAHVGEHQHYCGLHQWNIDLVPNDVLFPFDDDCKIWNKTKEFTLSAAFPGFKTVMKRELPYEPPNMIVSMYQKKI